MLGCECHAISSRSSFRVFVSLRYVGHVYDIHGSQAGYVSPLRLVDHAGMVRRGKRQIHPASARREEECMTNTCDECV